MTSRRRFVQAVSGIATYTVGRASAQQQDGEEDSGGDSVVSTVQCEGDDRLDQPPRTTKPREFIWDAITDSFDGVKYIHEGFSGLEDGDIVYNPHDGKYWMSSYGDLRGMCGLLKPDRGRYNGDYFDCEDYAMLMAAVLQNRFGLNQLGVVHSFNNFSDDWHVFNIAALPSGDIRMYDAIYDMWFKPEDAEGKWDITSGSALITL